MAGKFRWFFRKRLRITLIGDPAKINQIPVELHEQQLQYPEYRYMDLMTETGCEHPFKEANTTEPLESTRTLPILQGYQSPFQKFGLVKIENSDHFRATLDQNSGLFRVTSTKIGQNSDYTHTIHE